MARMQITGIDDSLYQEIKRMARVENRSVSQQALFLVKEQLAKAQQTHAMKTPARTLLELSGSWLDDREAEEIVADIRSARRNSRKIEEDL